MASLRIGTSALRSSIAKPVQTAALNGARCYSSVKAKVIWPSFQLPSQLTC
jgi:citrate synthase